MTATARTGAQIGNQTQQSLTYGLTSSVLTIVFVALVPLFVYATVPFPTSNAVPGEVVLSLLIVLLCGTRLAFVIGAGRQNLFTFSFWLFAYVFIAVPAFAQILTQKFPGTTPNVALEYNMEALVVVLVGIVAVMVGGLFVRGNAGAGLRPPTRVLSKTKITLLAVAGFVAWALYVARIGPGTFFTSRETMAAVRSTVFADPTTSTIVTATAALPLLVCIHAMTRYRRTEKAEGKHKRSFTLMLPAAVIAVLFAINIFTSSRYLFGTMAFSLLVLVGGFATRSRARWSMGALVFVLLAAFPLFSIFRRDATQTNSQLGAGAFINSGDYDSFAQINNAVNYVATDGIIWGKQLLGPLVFWVPRSVWADKPIDTGVLIAQFRGYRFDNLSSPFWAEAFLSGGWVGVVVLFVALGYVLKRADGAARGNLYTAGVAGITIAILSFYLLILLRGSLLQATSTLAVIVVSIWIVSSPARRSLPVRTRAPS
ncbi:hypothetical protein [Herbiconiux daphne]|uniref:Oligosaccharide repeat unit polymerase n=1 Tax=Herbiconiux daphne TaxID=2970914 RepID=A0ABT2H6J1_9MICO|nr:hypothetical protein [Herbiconiux daphne]MCS5735571.1 hypothetical protein [Herbiconiux daphne]